MVVEAMCGNATVRRPHRGTASRHQPNQLSRWMTGALRRAAPRVRRRREWSASRLRVGRPATQAQCEAERAESNASDACTFTTIRPNDGNCQFNALCPATGDHQGSSITVSLDGTSDLNNCNGVLTDGTPSRSRRRRAGLGSRTPALRLITGRSVPETVLRDRPRRRTSA